MMMRVSEAQMNALGATVVSRRRQRTVEELRARYEGEETFEQWYEGLRTLAARIEFTAEVDIRALGHLLIDLPDTKEPPTDLAAVFERTLMDQRRSADERIVFLRRHVLPRIEEQLAAPRNGGPPRAHDPAETSR